MKRLLQCEEWSRLRVGHGRELETLDDLTSILSAWKHNTGSDPSAYFDMRGDSLTPKFWSGTLDTPRFVLEVSPIGSTTLEPATRARLDANISAMLAAAMSSSSLDAGISTMSVGEGRHDALLGAFCNELQIARRRHILRRYSTMSDNLPSPKGRIAFPRQCYESIRTPGRFSSEWVALTEDVPENRVFKEVLLRYRSRCATNTRSKIDYCLAELDAVKRSGDYRLEWPSIRADRLSNNYLSLLKQSKALLDGDGAGLFSGEILANSEIVFTSRLFERFVAREIMKIAPSLGFKAVAQERGIYLCARETGANSFEVIPDLRVLDGEGKTKFIVDTKWKTLNHELRNLGISSQDVYQVLIYAAKHECTDVVLLYPDTTPATGGNGYCEKFTSRLAGVQYHVHILKLPLLAPNLSIPRDRLRMFLTANSARLAA
ncbi:MAG TPA: hypothetical protein VK629_14005 [Steroidobacteraceae bacterium]|nr:hypothetical protein [Steroidobacteraceae bacterium]